MIKVRHNNSLSDIETKHYNYMMPPYITISLLGSTDYFGLIIITS